MNAPEQAWTLEWLLGRGDAQRWAAALSCCEAISLPGSASRFAELYDHARLLAALARAQERSCATNLGFIVVDPLGDGLAFTEPLELAAIDEQLGQGRTICVTALSACDPQLDVFAQAINRSLDCASDVRFNAYLSPAGARTPFHTDVRASTTLQLTGRKRWCYQSRPATPYPSSNAQADRWGDVQWMNPFYATGEPPPLPSRDQLEARTLGPGDLLHVPAGAWHEVVTEEQGLALNLSVRLTPRLAV